MCSAWPTKLAVSNCFQSQFNGFLRSTCSFCRSRQSQDLASAAAVMARALRRFQLWPILGSLPGTGTNELNTLSARLKYSWISMIYGYLTFCVNLHVYAGVYAKQQQHEKIRNDDGYKFTSRQPKWSSSKLMTKLDGFVLGWMRA